MATSIIVTMCRFDSDKLVRESKTLAEIEHNYYAVSHVWGDADWRKLSGMNDDEVLVSESKAKFIVEQLPSAVGAKYFWMDVLCIDQRSESARIAVVQHIPSIFRQAAKTIVIKDGWGVRKCCMNAMGAVKDWFDMENGARTRWTKHLTRSHLYGLEEGVIDRLWPLQEVILSDHLQFLSCDEPGPEEEKRRNLAREFDPTRSRCTLRALPDEVDAFAMAWSKYGLGDEVVKDDEIKFIDAFLNNRSASRKQTARDRLRFFGDELWSQLNSMRRTSKARDFILAVMPQYGWYRTPPNVRAMSFGELFVDCFEQGKLARYGFAPLISSGIIDGARTDQVAIAELPTPACLGDFVKLLRGPTPHSIIYMPIMTYIGITIQRVNLQDVLNKIDMLEALVTIRYCMSTSPLIWAMSHRGELHQYGAFPECYTAKELDDDELDTANLAEERKLFQSGTQEARHRAEDLRKRRIWFAHLDRKKYRKSIDPEFCSINTIKVLNAMWAGLYEQDEAMRNEWHWLYNWLLKDAPSHLYIENLIRLAALITCGLGISAFEWSKRHLTPMLADLDPQPRLVLVSQAYLRQHDENSREFFMVEKQWDDGQGGDQILMARTPGRNTLTTIGLFPTPN